MAMFAGDASSECDMATPYFIIDEVKLKENLAVVEKLKHLSGAKVLLALKCFSTWGAFPVMKDVIDGTTSSGLYETRLGYERFGGETWAYSVAWSAADARDVSKICDKLVFNSERQLAELADLCSFSELGSPRPSIGLRVNPGTSHSPHPLSDPCGQLSRLGVSWERLKLLFEEGVTSIGSNVGLVDGLMFHMNCENDDASIVGRQLDIISERCGRILEKVSWVSLGGGMAFTNPGYDVDTLAKHIKEFSSRHGNVQVYLEPGAALLHNTTSLVTTVLDVMPHHPDPQRYTLTVDSATEAHHLDCLIFKESPQVKNASSTGSVMCTIAACSCLAGDVFGNVAFDEVPKVGDTIEFLNSGAYTMVKLNWFNGLRMPSIHIRRVNGSVQVLAHFDYSDFERAMGR
jgi:carboxynorspermidine decarboxylase